MSRIIALHPQTRQPLVGPQSAPVQIEPLAEPSIELPKTELPTNSEVAPEPTLDQKPRRRRKSS